MRERGGRHGEARGLSRMPPASAPRADSLSNPPGAGSGELWLCPRRSPCLPRFLPVLGAAGQGCQAGQRQGLLQSVTSATPALRGPSEMARGSGRQAGLAERSWDRPVVGQDAVAPSVSRVPAVQECHALWLSPPPLPMPPSPPRVAGKDAASAARVDRLGRVDDRVESGRSTMAVRIRHRDRRTRGTLSLQGPHGGNTANTILNNPVGQAKGYRGQPQLRGYTPLLLGVPDLHKLGGAETPAHSSIYTHTHTQDIWGLQSPPCLLEELLGTGTREKLGFAWKILPTKPRPSHQVPPLPALDLTCPHSPANAPRPQGSPSAPSCRACA